MNSNTRPVILVHGAWHAGWCWDPFLPYLSARGLSPLAPDLPGHGRNPAPTEDVTLAGYTNAVVELLDTLNEPALLVGHSMSGAIISEVAERRPDRVRYLVYISAFLLPDGVATAQRMKEDTESLAARFVRRSADGKSLEMGEEGLRSAIYDGMTGDQTEWAMARVQPQVIAPMTTPVHVTDERFGLVPRAFVESTRDKAITIDMQRRMQRDLPCKPVLTLDCGHFPALLEPAALADFVARL